LSCAPARDISFGGVFKTWRRLCEKLWPEQGDKFLKKRLIPFLMTFWEINPFWPIFRTRFEAAGKTVGKVEL
jgi:hypothetical protein